MEHILFKNNYICSNSSLGNGSLSGKTKYQNSCRFRRYMRVILFMSYNFSEHNQFFRKKLLKFLFTRDRIRLVRTQLFWKTNISYPRYAHVHVRIMG